MKPVSSPAQTASLALYRADLFDAGVGGEDMEYALARASEWLESDPARPNTSSYTILVHSFEWGDSPQSTRYWRLICQKISQNNHARAKQQQ